MEVDFGTIEKRFAAMTDQEFDLVRRADLAVTAQAIYDRELQQRNPTSWAEQMEARKREHEQSERTGAGDNPVAYLSAAVGPSLFALSWMYGVAFESGLEIRKLEYVTPHPILFLSLLAIGLSALSWSVAWSRRHAPEARGVLVPILALGVWCLVAVSIYYLPWKLADILTHYAQFTFGDWEFGDLLRELVTGGGALATSVALVSTAVAARLSSWSCRANWGDREEKTGLGLI